jgi:hypothetical protein
MSEAEIPHTPEPPRRFYRIDDTFEVPDFKDASFVNALFLTLVVGTALAEAAIILAELYRVHVVDLYRSQAASMRDVSNADGITRLVQIGFQVVFLAYVTCMLFWMFRNYKNSIALARAKLRYSARGATLGVIIPVLSLYRPYLAVAEMTKIAKDASNWSALKAPAYFYLWWFFQIVSLSIVVVLFYTSASEHGVAKFYKTNYLSIAAESVFILKNLCLTLCILRIWSGAHQREKAEPPPLPSL